MPEKIAIIGAGIGGLSVAVRLAAKGHEVHVFEKNSRPGGKMDEIRHEGFRFDTGPSLFTLPELVRELFELAGKDFSGEFPFQRLDNICRYFYEDGMVINAHGDKDKFVGELAEKAGEDRRKVTKYFNKSRSIFHLTYPFFIERSLHRAKTFLRPSFIPALLRLYQIKPLTRLHQLHGKTFRHPNVVQLFDRFATYNGSDPYKTPATMMVIPHLEHNLGAYFPVNGMYQIAASLESLGRELGVKYHYGIEVEEIIVGRSQFPVPSSQFAVRSSKKIVQGIRIRPINQERPTYPIAKNDKPEMGTGNGEPGTGNGEPGTGNWELGTDFSRVVTDLDVFFVYKKLLKSIPFPEKWFRHERSTSALIFYWGMKTVSPGLDVHNILFSANYREEFTCLFEKKSLYEDPTVYLFISSKIVPGDAPEGCENWFVMINTPENIGQDWDTLIAEARGRIQEKILRVTGIDTEKFRKFEFIQDPRSIERTTASYRGSLYGNSSNTMFAAFQRHPNFSRIKGLYLTGGSVHPGGGIPLCLSSARIVSEMIPKAKNGK